MVLLCVVSGASIPGGLSPVPVDDAGVLEARDVALSHLRTQESSWELVLTSAQVQVVAGLKYYLQFSGAKNNNPVRVQMVVFRDLNGHSEVTDMQVEALHVDPLMGGWTQADVNDPVVREASQAVLHHLDASADSDLTLTRILDAQTQVVAGLKIKLVYAARDSNGGERRVECIVYRDLQGQHHVVQTEVSDLNQN
jgi:hypothetical protein